MGYGLLRYLNAETAAQLRRYSQPQLGFNYLGHFTVGAAPAWVADEAGGLGGGSDPAMPLSHVVEVNALTVDSSAGATLSATWTWAPA